MCMWLGSCIANGQTTIVVRPVKSSDDYSGLTACARATKDYISLDGKVNFRSTDFLFFFKKDQDHQSTLI